MIRYFVYDIETFPNVFLCCVQCVASGEIRQFEVSERRDDGNALRDLLYWIAGVGGVMVGFNNVGFDYPVLHHCITRASFAPDVAYSKASAIISAQDNDDRFSHMVWDSERIVKQLDLYKIHHFDNRARTTSLKALQFAMRATSIEEMPIEPGTWLSANQIDTLIAYNQHDVTETTRFFHKSKEAVRFREELSAKYGIDFTNHNDTKIGKDFFINELESANPGICYDKSSGRRIPRQTFRGRIPLANIIFPYVSFAHPELKRVHTYLCGLSLTDTKGADELKDLSATVNGLQLDYGTGGIHGSVSNRTIRATESHAILDVDVASMYPNIAIVNRLFPAHLSTLFCDIYQTLYEQRKKHKKGSAENAMLKLALNGVYGDSNNVFSPFYDPQYTMTVTVNGQLLLSMLIDAIATIPDCEIIQANTDGVSVYINRSLMPQFEAVCRQWEATTRLQLESVSYAAMFVRDVNNYIAVSTTGDVKRKGAYEHAMQWHQDASALIIPKAVEAHLVHGVDAASVIENHTNAFDFMMRAKVPRTSRLESTDGDTLQRTTRYYIANDGPSLVKIMPPLARKPGVERRIGISAGWSVGICNVASDFDWRRLNRGYYIKEARKLINAVSTN